MSYTPLGDVAPVELGEVWDIYDKPLTRPNIGLVVTQLCLAIASHATEIDQLTVHRWASDRYKVVRTLRWVGDQYEVIGTGRDSRDKLLQRLAQRHTIIQSEPHFGKAVTRLYVLMDWDEEPVGVLDLRFHTTIPDRECFQRSCQIEPLVSYLGTVLEAYSRVIQDAKDLPLPALTKRETQVIKELVKGNTRVEIADRLSISPKTVSVHQANIMIKLEAKTHVELGVKAVEFGYV